MRRQPVTHTSRARWHRSFISSTAVLAAAALAACSPDESAKHETPQAAADRAPIAARIDRTRKGDRLAAAYKPSPPSLEEARARALRAEQSSAPLAKFYRALSELHSGLRNAPVTVLHLGDSHIAADNFSGDLRKLFQDRFGDAGRGMMMPGFPFPYYRARGVTFSKKGSWTAANSLKGDSGAYGLSGVRLTSMNAGAELRLKSKHGAAEWAEVTFLAQPGGGNATVSFGEARQVVETAASKTGPIRVRIDRKGRELAVKTGDKNPVSILSWSIGQNRPGLRYVNFGIPGATADTPRRWEHRLVGDGLARLKPDLIVLGYGTNEGFNDALDEDGYETRVGELVAGLKQAAPQASILILGPPDSLRFPRYARPSGKKALAAAPCRELNAQEREHYAELKRSKSAKLSRWHQPPSLQVVRAALAKVAETHDARFWDWSQVMGGACGIHAWANADPPLAASDRVHMRSRGARKAAEALFRDLMRGYEAHVRLASR